MKTLELDDGQIIAEYDPSDGEVVSVEDWHGHEASDYWYRVACEKVQEILADQAEFKNDVRNDR